MTTYRFTSNNGKADLTYRNGTITGEGSAELAAWFKLHEQDGVIAFPPIGPSVRFSTTEQTAVLFAMINVFGQGQVMGDVPPMPDADHEYPSDAVF